MYHSFLNQTVETSVRLISLTSGAVLVNMICRSINDWRIYPRLAAVIYPHTRTLTHGHHHQTHGRAQSVMRICRSRVVVWHYY